MVFEVTKPTAKIVPTSVSFAGGHDLEKPDNRFINAFRWRKGKETEKTTLAYLIQQNNLFLRPGEAG